MTDSIQELRGKRIVVRFDARRCIHSRNCVSGLPDVFVPGAQSEWIKPDAASAEAVAAVVRECPSGALTYERLDACEQEQPPAVNVARVRENGPIVLQALAEIEGHGKATRAAVCRCGASKRKPFCDGSHVQAGFKATGEPSSRSSVPLDIRNGPVTVVPQKDGPLKIEGSLEVCSGTGRTLVCGTRTLLCRCGGSATKPLCDGSHKKLGFTAD